MKRISIITIFFYFFTTSSLIAAWETDIQLSRETSQPKITIGIGDKESRLESPPDPPEYFCLLNINQYQISDWTSTLATLIQQQGQQSYCWGLSVNPHGNQGPPIPMTALMTWDFANIPGTFELREGYNCQGNIVVPDMKTKKEYQMTGASQIFNFTINYIPKTNPDSYVIEATAGNNGTISPSGSRTITAGNDAVFLIEPMTGFVIDEVLVDEISEGAIDKYTFTNVQSNHSIAASFKSSTPEIHEITPLTGSIYGNETIQITGSHFSNGIHVYLDDIEVSSVNVMSDSLLTFILPPHASGTVLIKLKNNDGIWEEEPITFQYTDSGQNGESNYWEANIQATREDASPKITIGVGPNENFIDFPPDPPEYKVKISIKRFQIEDWNSTYQRLIYQSGQDEYCYEIAVNPRGNTGPPEETSVVSFELSHVDGHFSLREGWGCNGETLISDMKAITQHSVTGGSGDQYFSIIYTSTDEDTIPPDIALKGKSEISVEKGEPFTDPGATAIDNRDGDISDQIIVDNTVNTDNPGCYTITYRVSDSSNNVAEKIRKVCVVPKRPVIILKGNDTDSLERCREYVDPGATASDDIDGDITSQIETISYIEKSSPGIYTIAYLVTNSSGISAIPEYRTVKVIDNQPPVLTLLGNAPFRINAGDSFIDPGATATDPICDTDLSSDINVDLGNLNTSSPGTYQISYTVQDVSGNISTKTRDVAVQGSILTVTPSEIHFGYVNIASPKTETVSVANTGDGQLVIDNVTISGQQANEFNIVSDSCSGSSLSNDQSCTIDVQFSPTCESAEINYAAIDIQSNDQSIPDYEISLDGEKGNFYNKPYLSDDSMIISGLIYDNQHQEIPINTEIAAFVKDEKSQLILVGHCRYNSEGYGLMNIYADDSETEIKDGAVNGDIIILKAFMADTCTEYTLNSITEDPFRFTIQDNQIINWQLNTIQLIPLRAGWNLISFYINKCFYIGEDIPTAPMINNLIYVRVNSIADILHSIDGQYSYVKGFDGKAKTYNLSKWSNMKYMAAGYAYWIRINEDANFDNNDLIYLKLEGSTIAGNVSIPLQKGWNFVGYLGSTVQYLDVMPKNIHFIEPYSEKKIDSIADLFQSIDGQYSYIRGYDKETGFTPYVPNLTVGKNQLYYVGPGYGYCLKMETDSPDSLTWNELSN
ncbi:lipoprotein [Candidatus Magnetomorum sp. HK-1]|nr:lipoprotein [Candidatus Magnetomorum sp. HK-1]